MIMRYAVVKYENGVPTSFRGLYNKREEALESAVERMKGGGVFRVLDIPAQAIRAPDRDFDLEKMFTDLQRKYQEQSAALGTARSNLRAITEHRDRLREGLADLEAIARIEARGFRVLRPDDLGADEKPHRLTGR